jgi:hypothetical protein
MAIPPQQNAIGLNLVVNCALAGAPRRNWAPGSLAPLHRLRQLLHPKLLQPQLPPQHTPQPTVAEGPRPAQHRATAFTSASTSPSRRRLSCRRETLEVFDGHQQPCLNFGAASAITHLTQFDMDAVARLSRGSPDRRKQAQCGVLRYFIAKDKLAFSDEIRMGAIPDAVGASWRT